MTEVLLVHMGIAQEDDGYLTKLNEYINGSLKDKPLPGYPHITPRKIQQALGLEFRDAVDRNLFLDIWWKRWGTITKDLINESVRFGFEADFIRSKGGVIVQVVNPRTEMEMSHGSEAMDFKADIVLKNETTFEDLYTQVEAMLELLEKDSQNLEQLRQA